MPTTFIGNETAEATLLGLGKKKAAVCKYTALQTGVVEEIKAKLTQKFAEASNYDVGIYADNAGVPGTLLGHKATGSYAQTAEQTVTARGLSVPVTEGTVYWLGFLNLNQEAKYKYKKEAGHEEVLEQATEWAELKESAVWTKIVESSKATFWGGSASAGTIFSFQPPTLHSPSGLYKPFPIAAATQLIEANVVFGKASGALLLTGESKATVINKVLASATGALLLTGTSHGVAIQKVTASAAGALLLTGTSVAIVRNVVIGKASGTLFLLGSGHVLEPKGEVGKRIAIFIFED